MAKRKGDLGGNPNPVISVSTQFKKGNKAALGRKNKKTVHVTSESVKTTISKLMKMSKEQLEAVIRDPNTKAGDLAFASILVQAIKRGDPQRLEAMLSRVVGKVKDEVKVETETKIIPAVVFSFDDETISADNRTIQIPESGEE